MAQLKDSYYWPNYMCTYLWSLLRLRVVTMSTYLNYIGLGTGEEWWCSDNQVTVSEKWMTAVLAQAVDTHFNKVSKNRKRRSQKRKHHSLNSCTLGVTMCPIHWGHRSEQNKTKQKSFSCVAYSGGRDSFVCWPLVKYWCLGLFRLQ